VFAALVAAALAAAALAAEPKPPEVSVALFPEADGWAAGRPLDVGVRLRLPEGWHVYWENPGDSGLATEVELVGPEGFAPGGPDALRYPAPTRFDAPGGLVGYGYEGEAMLFYRVRPPDPLPPGPGSLVTLRVRWLACREVCVKGEATPAFSLQHSASPSPRHAATLDPWRARLSRPLSAHPGASAVSEPGEGGSPLVVVLPGATPRDFYPGADTAADLLEVAASGEVLRARLRPWAGASPTSAGGLVIADGPEGPLYLAFTTPLTTGDTLRRP